jgi:hypothetical protein
VQSDELLTAFLQLEAMFFGGNYPRIVSRKHLGGRHRICFQWRTTRCCIHRL